MPATDARLNGYLDTIRDPARPWRMCHIDGLVLDGKEGHPVKIIEGKTSSVFRKEWGEGDDAVPEEYVVQCTHNAGVFKAAFNLELPVDMPVLIGGQKFRIYTVLYRESLDELLIGRELAFWTDHVQGQEPPKATPDERGKRGLGSLYCTDSGEEMVVDADSPICLAMEDLRKAKEQAKAADTALTAAENVVKEFMQTATKLIGPTFEVSWKKSKDSQKTDWEDVLLQLGHLVPTDAYTAAIKANTTTVPGSRRFGMEKAGR